MKKRLQTIALILLAAASVYNATQVHSKMQDGCSGEWKRAVNREKATVTESRSAGTSWKLLPVSRLIKVDL